MNTDTETPRYWLGRWKPIAVDDLVRIGRDRDGGYVISARCVASTKLLIALGISDDWSFEEAFVAGRPEIDVVGVDGSVSADVFWRSSMKSLARAIAAAASLRLPTARQQVRTAISWWGHWRRFRTFFGPSNRTFHRKFISEDSSEWTLTFREMLAAHLPAVAGAGAPVVFLKMDIEGAEYRLLPDILDLDANLSGMVIEFHDCDLLWERFEELMERLTQTFAVVHLHGNNSRPLIRGTLCPRFLEVSLLNRGLFTGDLKPTTARYPLPGVDKPNDPSREDYPLQF